MGYKYGYFNGAWQGGSGGSVGFRTIFSYPGSLNNCVLSSQFCSDSRSWVFLSLSFLVLDLYFCIKEMAAISATTARVASLVGKRISSCVDVMEVTPRFASKTAYAIRNLGINTAQKLCASPEKTVTGLTEWLTGLVSLKKVKHPGDPTFSEAIRIIHILKCRLTLGADSDEASHAAKPTPEALKPALSSARRTLRPKQSLPSASRPGGSVFPNVQTNN